MRQATTGPSATPAPAVVAHRWPTALVLASAMFLVLFDSLAVATALPRIGAEFRLGPGRLQWVVTLYSLSIGGLLLLGGRLCDLWGRRRLIVVSLALATLGSALAGLATALLPLLLGRVLQGVGAALAIPATLASAATFFPDEPWRSRVFAVVAAAANTAGLAGAIVGGLITSHLGWRWVFLATVPVGLVAMVAARVLLPVSRPEPGGRQRLDLAGAVLATGMLLALIFGANRIAESGPDPVALGAVAASGVLLFLLVRVERRVADPLVRPALLRSRPLVAGCLAFAAHSAAYAVVVVVGSLYLQEVHGLSPAGAGLVLAPVLLGALVSAAPAGALIRRFGARRVVAVALALCAVTLALVAVSAGGPLILVTTILVAWGLSAGPIYVGLTRVCVGDAPPGDQGTASAVFESTTHVAGAISVAVFLTLLAAGVGYGVVQFVGAVAGGLGVLALLLIMPAGEPGTAPKPAPQRVDAR
ncbi:MFS transporter [Micromonospora tulbaghiae]|uniref:MFS transporter n=1 Tax=Micromonospora tulbaghiae TaxID=479978 RepID=UPI00332009C1